MKNRVILRVVAFCMAFIVAFAPITASAASLLKLGSKGREVTLVQSTLKDLGYYTYPKTTGYYGSVTAKAVKRFQKAYGLPADGIVGSRTRNALLGKSETKTSNIKLMKTAAVAEPAPKGDLDWFKQVQYIFARGTEALVTDVVTGKSFHVRRTFGTNHADVEALTKEDTATIREIWRGFSWERRAVVVKVGTYYLAGSMTAMPHAGVDAAPAIKYVRNRSAGYGYGQNLDLIKNNGMNGHMDIHFKNSRTHGTNIVQKSHQDMVKKAAIFIGRMTQNQGGSQDGTPTEGQGTSQAGSQTGDQDTSQTAGQTTSQDNSQSGTADGGQMTNPDSSLMASAGSIYDIGQE